MKTGRKISGGKYIKARKKKSFEGQGQRRTIKLNEDKRRVVRTRGGNEKIVLLAGKSINVLDEKTNKTKKVEIKNVIETPSNRFLARQNIITKGAIVETEVGKVRVSNRPSQEGQINGVLIKE